jgi:hypothetical protein
VFDCPTHLAITDAWIAGVVELQCLCGIGRWADNMLCLVDICQWMRVGACRGKAYRASGRCCGGIIYLACRGMRRQGKSTQLSRSPSPTGKHPNTFNRGTGPGI